MTLAHELGHLFCGHVGADKGDPWDNRVCTEATSEFEAESVAFLVTERLAPGLEMPDATLRILQPQGGLLHTTGPRPSERPNGS
jgi:Zn-dependent peptidase ImmA (M78 family)